MENINKEILNKLDAASASSSRYLFMLVDRCSLLASNVTVLLSLHNLNLGLMYPFLKLLCYVNCSTEEERDRLRVGPDTEDPYLP